jgi:hypothetical protein
MHHVQRPRREVSPALTVLARPFLRYSVGREAYVLRGVGNRMGPVLKPRRTGRFDRHTD